MANKNILLIEPSYKNKYPPLGLMKLAQYHGSDGKNDNVTFVKGEDKRVLDNSWDRVYVTTLFSFEWSKISRAIDFAIEASHRQPQNVFVGGIAASLMHRAFVSEDKWSGVRFIKGLLSESPAISLQLDEFAEELYSDDTNGIPIEDLIPDYDILGQIDYQYAVSDAYFLYASRGCVRKCKFCGVPKLEGDQRDAQSITPIVNGITKLYGERKDLILMDNNVVASPRYKEIIAEIRDLGFHKGATISRGNRPVSRRVDFNQGVDARILCKDKMFLREMSSICIKPLRIAFDHLGLKKPYERAVRYAHEFDLTQLSNYMLYNFYDSPSDLYQRMLLNVELNEELDIRIFSFPMRYQPTDLKDRSHVGPNWTKYHLRSMQMILQATHGVVSGSPTFFRKAFGETEEQFLKLLMRPHAYIFHRFWYEEYGGKQTFEEYTAEMSKLGAEEEEELLALLSEFPPSQYQRARKCATSTKVRKIMRFYLHPKREKFDEISLEMKSINRGDTARPYEVIPEDEFVEDAGLGAAA